MASNEDRLRGPGSCCQRWSKTSCRFWTSNFTLSPDLFGIMHKPSMTKRECDGLLGLSSVGLSQEVCRRSPVCWYITDSRASRSESWFSVRCRVQVRSRTSLGINCEKVSLAANGSFIVHKHVHSCVIFLERSFHRIPKSTSLVRLAVYPSCACCFPR